MKKLIYVLLAAGIIASSTSCRESYTCQCTLPSMSRQNLTIYASSLGNAEKKCARQNGDGDNGGSVGCHILN